MSNKLIEDYRDYTPVHCKHFRAVRGLMKCADGKVRGVGSGLCKKHNNFCDVAYNPDFRCEDRHGKKT